SKGGKVGVEHGSWPHYLLDKRGISTASYMNQPEILDAVARGEVTAGLVTNAYAGWFLKQHPGALRISTTPMPADLRWNVGARLMNADRSLLGAFNDSLDRLVADQTVARIFAQYGVAYTAPRP